MMNPMNVDLNKLIEKKKLLTLSERSRAVFVGDTHGDLEASRKIWERFEDEVKDENTYLVFLGDYVDRGRRSRENIDFLISRKAENPNGVILLLGNHEAYPLQKLRPANFWQSLGRTEYDYYKNLANLPWIAQFGDLVAAHGALPFVSDLEEIKNSRKKHYEMKNDIGLPIWVSIAWGDLNQNVGQASIDPITGRPQFGKKVFLEYMDRYGQEVLIRSHQPGAQGWMFERRALTIFTSQVYVQMGRARERNVAIAELEGNIASNKIEVVTLGQI